jgi:hypothetical protein
MRNATEARIDGDERPGLNTRQKARKINLDPQRYGTFAEIGADGVGNKSLVGCFP